MSYSILPTCTGCTACRVICPVNAITGERKQQHVIDPSICIDCGACGRVCNYQAVLDQRQMLTQPLKRALWLKPLISADKCVSCGVCLQVCPTGVLEYAELMNHQVHTVAWLSDPAHCIGCSLCETACPVEAIRMRTPPPRSEAQPDSTK